MSERLALTSFYNQMSGTNWTQKNGWMGKAGTECQWFGVTCLNNAHVIKLTLPNNRLIGKISSNISLLSSLEELDLSENHISGTLKRIETLTQLKILRLTDNQLSGSLPPELSRLTKLEILALNINNFSGQLPREIGQLPHLRELDLSENLFYDQLPIEIGKLLNLEELHLSKNQLIGTLPNEIKSLTKLHSFSFFDNCLILISHKGKYLLPITDHVVNLDIGDQNMCNGNQHNSLPIVATSEDYDIYIPSVSVGRLSYEVYLARYQNPLDKHGWYWSVEEMNSFDRLNKKPSPIAVRYNEKTSTLFFNSIRLSHQIITATLNRYHNPSDANKTYFQYKP
jgi:hypothetical protein